jgi:tripartite-type tricarboxylate transporter receptor subunit TctC
MNFKSLLSKFVHVAVIMITTNAASAQNYQLNRAFTQSLHDPENEKKLANLGCSPIANSPQEVDAQWHALVQQWTTVIDKANIKVE